MMTWRQPWPGWPGWMDWWDIEMWYKDCRRNRWATKDYGREVLGFFNRAGKGGWHMKWRDWTTNEWWRMKKGSRALSLDLRDCHWQWNTVLAALDWLVQIYHICHICISAYNSQANSVVKHSHHGIHNSLVKACNSDISQWPTLAHHIFWANHISTMKSTVNPHSWGPDISQHLDTADLITVCTRQLAKREAELSMMHEQVLKSCLASVADFECCFVNTIQDFDPWLSSCALKMDPIDSRKLTAQSQNSSSPPFVSSCTGHLTPLKSCNSSIWKILLASLPLKIIRSTEDSELQGYEVPLMGHG